MPLDSNLVIRRAEALDATLLSELGARTFSETFADDNSAADMAAYLAASFNPQQQAAELTDANATFRLAEIDGVAVGYAMLRSGEATAGITINKPIELVRLYVSREYLGRGVGAALMQVCIDDAKRQGFQTLWLGVWEHNQRAQKFYRKWGFRGAGRHTFQLGGDAQTDLLLELSLS